jgi:predicted GNAT family acetyltransferase
VSPSGTVARQMEVTDNQAERRYEARTNGEIAGYLFYRERPGGLVLVHTEVADGFEGQGIGGQLVAAALDDIRQRGLSVTPLCRFAAGYIDRHQEYADLVAA